jgi:hypothetical protein
MLLWQVCGGEPAVDAQPSVHCRCAVYDDHIYGKAWLCRESHVDNGQGMWRSFYLVHVLTYSDTWCVVSTVEDPRKRYCRHVPYRYVLCCG